MRLSRLLGLRKFLVHLPSRIATKKVENFSISCENWYIFCELRKFSVLSPIMSIENPVVGGSTDSEIKTMNGLNGVSNGHSAVSSANSEVKEKTKSSSSSSHHHKSSSKDKHRDKDREHKSSKSSHSSSSHKEKQHSSSSNSRHDKDKHSSDRHKSSSDKDKHKSSSSSSKHHSSSSSGKDKHRDKDREHKSSKSSHSHSSSSKDKDREHRDKDKHHSSSSSSRHEKEKSDKDKDKHRSSSSKNHSSNSSSGKDKHRDKDREHRDKDKHHSSKSSSHDRHKDREKKSDENGVAHIKTEPIAVIKDEQPDLSEKHHFSFSESTAIQANGIRECFVNVSQISEASSCDYSMSQFRADESQFSIKGDVDDDSQEETCNFKGVGNDPLDHQDDEDMPIAQRKKIKHEISDDEDDIPLTARKKPKIEKKEKKIKREPSDDEDDDDKPKKKKIKKDKKVKVEIKTETASPEKKGRKKKEEENQEVWKWWEEEKPQDGTKWSFLEHKGPVFAPEYEPLPTHVVFEYDGHPMKLSQDAEEIAGFYARMLEHDYTSKDIFNNNFFKDWRKSMTSKEKEKITKLERCNFRKMAAYFQELSERNKNRTKEEKLAIKEENEKLISEYGFCKIDGHKEKIGNFKIEPPGLFRGRGEHPKMGLVKKRIMPEDVMINCSKNSVIPVPPKGHKWKEVRHDNTVTWLASWTENVQGQVKYVMLNPSSKLKGEKDWQKYETARRLHKHIEKIRSTYREEWKSKEMRIRQRAVALYFIDKLALRAGNEKDEDQADTVGCCSLRVEHIELHKELNGKENVVVFDFLGKDSIRYYNEVEVEKRVFKNLELFKENKKDGDDLFDRLNTVVMNEHLRDLMDGLTAKVFRTYNASWTLQNQLLEMTDSDASIPEKLLAYNRANRAVAILCNHQRAVPKGHEKSMENLKEKIRAKREQIDDLEVDVKDCVKAAKRGSVKEKVIADKKKKQLEKLKEQLKKLELQETDRDENKTIALGTSKLNYLDPRISVAWCKKNGVPIEKIYNKTQRDKFRWAIEMIMSSEEEYEF